VLELDENNIEAYGRLSSIYWAQNRLDEAKKSLEALAKQQSKPVAAETLIGMILVRQNKPDEARKHFERALEINSRAAVAANSLAWDYANTGGNLDVALQLAQAAKAQLPTVGEITDTLGWIYYKKGLSSLAVTTFREAVQQSPANPRIHYRLGLAHLQNGDRAAARSALQQALKLNLGAEDATEARRVLATLQG
jgi:tetratricopeptide (TPR) repeat protein